ncbi:MAG: hypothetical protein ACRYF0_11310 [Janthinobacterium lividum]
MAPRVPLRAAGVGGRHRVELLGVGILRVAVFGGEEKQLLQLLVGDGRRQRRATGTTVYIQGISSVSRFTTVVAATNSSIGTQDSR